MHAACVKALGPTAAAAPNKDTNPTTLSWLACTVLPAHAKLAFESAIVLFRTLDAGGGHSGARVGSGRMFSPEGTAFRGLSIEVAQNGNSASQN